MSVKCKGLTAKPIKTRCKQNMTSFDFYSKGRGSQSIEFIKH